MAAEITKDGSLPSINGLINDLRDDLRKELQLGKIEGDVTMFLLDYSHNKKINATQKDTRII